jgi:hypothetical protein
VDLNNPDAYPEEPQPEQREDFLAWASVLIRN